MSPLDLTVRRLVDDIVTTVGAEPPAVLAPDAPVLQAQEVGELYYVGLIGGKDVGKTSLVNAIAGQTIAEPTGHGEGTKAVTAYAHHDAAEEVRAHLGNIAVIEHDVDTLRRQVLLDLPDIDSKYADHVSLTRKMLQYMLYPVWVQSVEKYADARPQELLRQVSEGNDPANFLFVLNKCDQLIDREGLQAAGELADDYATRLRKVLRLKEVPEVLLVAATRPEDYDLPRLRKLLGVQRSQKQLARSKELANRRRLSSVAEWVEAQDLPRRVTAAERLSEEASELIGERLGVPVLEEALPRLEQDPSHRIGMAEPAVRRRMRAWPIVNVIDAAFSPLVLLVRKNLAPAGDESAAVDAYLAEAGRSTAKNVQAVFAQLNAGSGEISQLYANRRLWEAPAAEEAAMDLRRRLGTALAQQRESVVARFTPPAWLAPWRWLLTLGAVLWFVIIQPVLEAAVDLGTFDLPALGAMAIEILSAEMLLTSAGFALLWLLVLWAGLRFGTYRRALAFRSRLLRREADTPEASPAAQTVEWMESLLAPLDRRRAELADLELRARSLREQLDVRSAA